MLSSKLYFNSLRNSTCRERKLGVSLLSCCLSVSALILTSDLTDTSPKAFNYHLTAAHSTAGVPNQSIARRLDICTTRLGNDTFVSCNGSGTKICIAKGLCLTPFHQRPSISRRETRDFEQIFHASVTLCDWLRLRLARFVKM